MEVLIQGNMKQLLEPILRKVFFDQFNQIRQLRSQLYTEVGSVKSKETDYSMGLLGTIPEFHGTLEYDTFEGLWPKEYTHIEYAKGIAIARKDIDDDQYNVLVKKLASWRLPWPARWRLTRLGLQQRFQYVLCGPDAVALSSASHPYSPSNAGVQSNTATAALSHDAVVAGRLAMRKWYDDRGNKISVLPDMLVIPPDLEETAYIITNAEEVPGTANNNKSIFQRWNPTVLVWDYLTSTTAWFLIDSTLMRQNLMWFTRIPTEFDAEQDFDTMSYRWKLYTRYSYGFNDWRWLYASTGAG